MGRLSWLCKTEAGAELIIEEYKNNMLADPVAIHKLTKEVLTSEGKTLDSLLMMAKVNVLFRAGEVD